MQESIREACEVEKNRNNSHFLEVTYSYLANLFDF